MMDAKRLDLMNKRGMIVGWWVIAVPEMPWHVLILAIAGRAEYAEIIFNFSKLYLWK